MLVLAAALSGPPAWSASPTLVVPDPAGDALDGGASVDVVSVTYDVKMSIDSIPKDARNGRKLTALRGYTTLAEPVFGIYGNSETDTDGLIAGAPHDDVVSDKEFTFS